MKYLKIISVLILSLVFTALLPSQNPVYANEESCTMSYPDGDKKITCQVFPEGIDVNTEGLQIVCSDLPGDKDGAYRLETYPQEAAPSDWLWFLGTANNWFSYNLGRDKYQTSLEQAISIDNSKKTNVVFYLNKSDHSRILSSGIHSFNLLWKHPRYSPIKCSPVMSYTVSNVPVAPAPVAPAPAVNSRQNQGSTVSTGNNECTYDVIGKASSTCPCKSSNDCQSSLVCRPDNSVPGPERNTCQQPVAPVPAAVPGKLGFADKCIITNDQCQPPFQCLLNTSGDGPAYYACQLGEGSECNPSNNERNNQCRSSLVCSRDNSVPNGPMRYTCQRPSAPAPVAPPAAPEISRPIDGAVLNLAGDYIFCVQPQTQAAAESTYKLIFSQAGIKLSEYEDTLQFAGSSCSHSIRLLANNPDHTKFQPGVVQVEIRMQYKQQNNNLLWTEPRIITINLQSVPAAPAVPPGQGTGGEIPTYIKVHIHGTNDTSKIKNGYLNLMKLDKEVVDVGARVYTTDTAGPQCNIKIKTVDLLFEKIADRPLGSINPRAIEPQRMNINLNGNSKPTNCWSFEAKVDGAGQYRLRATYPGDDKFAASEEVAYITISDKAQGDMYAKGTISTTTTIKIRSSGNKPASSLDLSQKAKTRVALQKGMKVSTTEQAINLLELIGAKAQDKIAGLAVKQNERGEYVLYNDPISSSDGFEITPATAVSGEECSIDKIPAINLVVNKILNNGSTVQILNEPNYPNCQPTTITYSALGDISQTNRVEISAGYANDAASEYNPSSGDLVLFMSDTPVEGKPYVKLSSNPSADQIAPYDGSVQIVAATNKAVANPAFEVIHNGVSESKPASFGSDNCSNGNGVCSYYLDIYQPVGQFTITFKNEGTQDTISFNTDDNTGTGIETDIIGAGILIGDQEILLPLDGSQIDLKLDPSGSNAYQVIIHRSNGLPDLRKTIIFNYSPSSGGACGQCIFSDANGCHQGVCENPNNCGFNTGCKWQPGCADVACPSSPTQSGPTDTQPQQAPVSGGACGECRFSEVNDGNISCHEGFCPDPNNCGFNKGCVWKAGCATNVACP